MSLLDNMPDRCTVQRRVRVKRGLGGSKATATVEQTGVHCWEQQVSASESEQYGKRGMDLTHRIYFIFDPQVTRRHQILVTSKSGNVVSSPIPFDVVFSVSPDASAGLGFLWKVNCSFNQGEDD